MADGDSVTDTDISGDKFMDDYLVANKPLVVRGWGQRSWPLAPPWDLRELARRFGDHRVPLFDTLFEQQCSVSFGEYVSAIVSGGSNSEPAPYMRWYSRQRQFQMLSADEVFAELAEDWKAPSWLPSGDYLLPEIKKDADPVTDLFPARGIFVCAAGGRTRLHVDPWASDACLCQITGDKRLVMYPPEAAEFLSDGDSVVDLSNPDTARFPGWNQITPALDVTLTPGDVIFIPAGWFHAVVALSASVSITWNFVHEVHADRFAKYLGSGGTADPTVKFFLRGSPTTA
jgi:Cupin-like domain